MAGSLETVHKLHISLIYILHPRKRQQQQASLCSHYCKRSSFSLLPISQLTDLPPVTLKDISRSFTLQQLASHNHMKIETSKTFTMHSFMAKKRLFKKLHNDGWYGIQKSTLEERFYLCSFPVGEKGDTMRRRNETRKGTWI